MIASSTARPILVLPGIGPPILGISNDLTRWLPQCRFPGLLLLEDGIRLATKHLEISKQSLTTQVGEQATS